MRPAHDRESTITRPARARYRRLGTVGVVLLAWLMWSAAALQLTNGVLDVVVFVPPSVTLGVAAVWSAHAFIPERFSWQRGLLGALLSTALGSPLLAFLVAFSAAWDRVSFPLVFTVGALLAIALGLVVGASSWVIGLIRVWRNSATTPGEARTQTPVELQ